MGCLGYSGTVHPQLPTALVITKGSLPVLVNLKTCLLSVSCMMRPKSWVAEAKPMEVVGPETAGIGAGGTKGSKVSLAALVTGATAALADMGAKVAGVAVAWPRWSTAMKTTAAAITAINAILMFSFMRCCSCMYGAKIGGAASLSPVR